MAGRPQLELPSRHRTSVSRGRQKGLLVGGDVDDGRTRVPVLTHHCPFRLSSLGVIIAIRPVPLRLPWAIRPGSDLRAAAGSPFRAVAGSCTVSGRPSNLILWPTASLLSIVLTLRHRTHRRPWPPRSCVSLSLCCPLARTHHYDCSPVRTPTKSKSSTSGRPVVRSVPPLPSTLR